MHHVLEPDKAPHSEFGGPFVIQVEHLDNDKRGTFRPAAFVRFDATLRTSGLLPILSPELAKDLLTLLTFVLPNGGCAPNIQQLADGMRVPIDKAHRRMERLIAFRWQGEPIISFHPRGSGLETYVPLPRLAVIREDVENCHSYPPAHPPLRAASRDEVVAHSRARYARPRQEVEREIERQLGHGRPESAVVGVKPEPSLHSNPEEKRVQQLLIEVGLLPEQAETLVDRYDVLTIKRQLAWLPFRGAKNPAGFLMAAVKDDYEAPPSMKRTQTATSSNSDAAPVSIEIPEGANVDI